jgi:hypothetical protein
MLALSKALCEVALTHTDTSAEANRLYPAAVLRQHNHCCIGDLRAAAEANRLHPAAVLRQRNHCCIGDLRSTVETNRLHCIPLQCSASVTNAASVISEQLLA